MGANLTRLGEGAFYNCAALESIVLPDSLKEIADKTFYKCASLASVTMGGSVERIGEYAFYSCNLLESVVLPASLRSLGSYAFRSCASLKSVTLRQSVEERGSHAFNGCNFLTLYCEGENAGGKWSARWNSGYRPVVWGCDLSENGDYVLSFTVGESSIENKTGKERIFRTLQRGIPIRLLDGKYGGGTKNLCRVPYGGFAAGRACGRGVENSRDRFGK